MNRTLILILIIVSVVVITSHAIRVDMSKLQRALQQGFQADKLTLAKD